LSWGLNAKCPSGSCGNLHKWDATPTHQQEGHAMRDHDPPPYGLRGDPTFEGSRTVEPRTRYRANLAKRRAAREAVAYQRRFREAGTAHPCARACYDALTWGPRGTADGPSFVSALHSFMDALVKEATDTGMTYRSHQVRMLRCRLEEHIARRNGDIDRADAWRTEAHRAFDRGLESVDWQFAIIKRRDSGAAELHATMRRLRQSRPRVRRGRSHAARRRTGIRSGSDPGGDGPPGEPPAGPKRPARYTFGLLTREQRGEE
jgi:hypothetical protein